MIDPAVLRQYAPTWRRACSMYAAERLGRSRCTAWALRILEDALRACDDCGKHWQVFRHELVRSECPYCRKFDTYWCELLHGMPYKREKAPRTDAITVRGCPRRQHEYGPLDFAIDFSSWCDQVHPLLSVMVVLNVEGISYRDMAAELGMGKSTIGDVLWKGREGYEAQMEDRGCMVGAI